MSVAEEPRDSKDLKISGRIFSNNFPPPKLETQDSATAIYDLKIESLARGLQGVEFADYV